MTAAMKRSPELVTVTKAVAKTDFQRRVLLAVSKIPKGEVRTYKWVAKRAGRPDASRAVGQILKRNPLPFVIPCHRVVKSDYGLGGYMFGKGLKRQLLRSEGLTVKKKVVIMGRKSRDKNQ